MKERQKKMLRFMLLNEGLLHIEDLAEAFFVGKRTVSRDLDVLDRWLSYRGASLERKPKQGIKILTFGKSAGDLLNIVNTSETYLESLEPEQRQKLILLYLLFNNREIKISSIANIFFISDTSVWSDLNKIEITLEDSGIHIVRMKGVGIRLIGDETAVRLKFLSIMTEVFSSHTIIPYLYTLKEDNNSHLEINQLKFIMKQLNFPGNNNYVLSILSEISKKLGYQFTMSCEALLYFYLQLSLHRIKSGALIIKGTGACNDFFHELGKDIIEELIVKVFSGKIPDGETEFLGLVLQVLEVGNLAGINAGHFNFLINPDIVDFTGCLIDEFGKLDKRQYYLNEQMTAVMQFTVASLVTRLRYGIPFWHGEWGDPSAETWNRESKARILSSLLESRFGLTAQKQDLDYILVYFHSMIFSNEDLPDRKIRCLICCFEGIGIASYLNSVLKREIDSINIVEATAVFKVRQEYLDANGIELVISTFPIADLDIPVINISLPINREKLVRKIASVVSDVKKKNIFKEPSPVVLQPQNYSAIPFSEILNFINDFKIVNFNSRNDINKIIHSLAQNLLKKKVSAKILENDFIRREDSGPLFFEDINLRLLHCKSSAVSVPMAGILQNEEDIVHRMIFLVAPSPCPDNIRKMLSTITISIIEEEDFRNAVLFGDIDQIKREMMELYKEV